MTFISEGPNVPAVAGERAVALDRRASKETRGQEDFSRGATGQHRPHGTCLDHLATRSRTSSRSAWVREAEPLSCAAARLALRAPGVEDRPALPRELERTEAEPAVVLPMLPGLAGAGLLGLLWLR
mmetsp:Transcript_25755/g.60773  ORF Transcript_25755/g.60773 Transcript_25755/m.60773 type:complete len:126 (-) Transcript_25755:1547-1924(-)